MDAAARVGDRLEGDDAWLRRGMFASSGRQGADLADHPGQRVSGSAGCDLGGAPGLADRAYLSFESKNYAGRYLRHRHGAVHQEPNDGSEQFALDATFRAVAGQNGQGISLISCNYPSRFLRHYGGEVFIAADGGPEPWDNPQWWADDVSWLAKPAWTL